MSYEDTLGMKTVNFRELIANGISVKLELSRGAFHNDSFFLLVVVLLQTCHHAEVFEGRGIASDITTAAADLFE